MTEAVVEPRRVRADTRLLWPDLHRPGFALRCAEDASVAASAADPAALCERIETELAGTAWRYRRLLVSGIAAMAVPAAWWLISWYGMWNVPDGMRFFPFTRGAYFPGPSFFEVSAAALLVVILVWGLSTGAESLRSMRRLGTDYRRLLAEDEQGRQAIAAEVSSGRWPRVRALLTLGREYADYRQLVATPKA